MELNHLKGVRGLGKNEEWKIHAVIWLVSGITVVVGLYLTKSPNCLLTFLLPTMISSEIHEVTK